MKTKYIKVEKSYQEKLINLQPVMLLNPSKGERIPDSFWAKEVPDHSEEMLSMLEECLEKLPINTDSQVAFCKKVEQLILKIKG